MGVCVSRFAEMNAARMDSLLDYLATADGGGRGGATWGPTRGSVAQWSLAARCLPETARGEQSPWTGA